MYFANPTGAAVEKMISGHLGYIDTPRQGNQRPSGVVWCADNGCFNDKTFSESHWWAWLKANSHDASLCRFATAPDVLGDHHATFKRSRPWLTRIRSLGYPAAFVAQDGATPFNTPWTEFDALFIGGTTEFKLSPEAETMIYAAKEHGKWVHIGRINSRQRYLRFAYMTHKGQPACDSCDGTYLVFGPNINLPKLLSWISEYEQQPGLFGETK